MALTTFIIFTIASGILPAVFWLWFWLREDQRRPEPTWMIASVFLLGSLMVIPAYFLEKLFAGQSPGLSSKIALSTIVVWATIEELLKYGAAYLGAFKRRFFDEPIDAMIYMITAALGFAAIENTLFIWNVLNAQQESGANSLSFVVTGNFRFVGAIVVHIVASAIIGSLIGLTFYQHRAKKIAATVVGLIIAVSLHALFNYTIIYQGENLVMTTFVGMWILAILVILLFERVKKIIIKTKLANKN